MGLIFKGQAVKKKYFLECFTLEDGTGGLFRNVCSLITINADVTSYKSQDLIYTAVEAWSQARDDQTFRRL